MELFTINTGFFKLDGGAMFGVVPKSLWNKLNPADDNNMCNWAMRCLLIKTNGRNILIDTGIGNKQSEKFYSYYYLSGEDALLKSLKNVGCNPEDITDVILTHLHFDHCGGAATWNEDKTQAQPTFPNATYYLTKEHWFHANNPNPREKASFLPENFACLESKIQFVEQNEKLFNCITIHVVNGHTVGMICPIIHHPQKTIFYAADLFPSSAHIPVNYVMGYDIEPLKTMKERQFINQLAVQNKWYYFFEHDPFCELSQVQVNERGQYSALI